MFKLQGFLIYLLWSHKLESLEIIHKYRNFFLNNKLRASTADVNITLFKGITFFHNLSASSLPSIHIPRILARDTVKEIIFFAI